MIRINCFLALLFAAGCSREPVQPEALPPDPATAVVETDTAGIAQAAPSIEESPSAVEATSPSPRKPQKPTDDQINRLFQTTWKANDQKTMASELNADVDKQTLKETSWLYCIQWKQTAFFKDAGIKWNDRINGSFLEELPWNGPEFAKKVRVIDKDNWAYLTSSGIWIVMDEVE